MPAEPLVAVVETHPSTAALLDGRVVPAGYRLAFEHVEPLNRAFRRMVRGNEFDVCEMALTTYFVAKEHGKPFTALPVFPVRMFPHASIVCSADRPIARPADLSGRRIGVRAYTVTTGVWARYVLADAGVDLDSVTWVVVDEEHVTEYVAPRNVEAHPGANLVDMLRAGTIDAGIGLGKLSATEFVPLYADPAAAAREFGARTGIFPINHTVVVRDELLRNDATLAGALTAAFAAAKAAAGDRADDASAGVEANRRTIEALLTFAQAQGLISRTLPLGELFAA